MSYSRLVKETGAERISSPVANLLVRSNIAYPLSRANLAAGDYTVWGFAWAGEDVIAHVDVSFDAGRTWNPSTLESLRKALTWVKWRWKASRGECSIMSRATDNTGNTQPLVRDPQRLDDSEVNWCRPVVCSVK